ALGFLAQRLECRGLLVIGEVVGVDGREVLPVVAQVARTAGRQQVQAPEFCGIRIAEPGDDLRAELRLVAAGDDGDLDDAQQGAQLRCDARIDRALRR